MEIINVPIKDLKPNEKNPRKITKRELQKLVRSIEEFGFVDPIIVNKNKTRFNIIVGGHLKQKFCSRECKGKYQSKNGTSKKGKTYPKLQRARIATCPICLKEFRAVKDQNGKFGGKIRKQIYCSKECWSKRNPPKAKKCYYCGKTYMSYEIETRVYCSKECRDLDYRERFKGEKSPLWKGGLTKKNKIIRTRSEYRGWRESVFKRDNYTCQQCGINNTYLQAHHKLLISKHPDKIYEIDNGVSLCVDCHQKKHPELHLNLKKRWEEME